MVPHDAREKTSSCEPAIAIFRQESTLRSTRVYARWIIQWFAAQRPDKRIDRASNYSENDLQENETR